MIYFAEIQILTIQNATRRFATSGLSAPSFQTNQAYSFRILLT